MKRPNQMKFPTRSIARMMTLLITAALATGCGPENTQDSSPWNGNGGGPLVNPGTVRHAPLHNTRVRASVLLMGSVPYDMQTVPLVSPDGQWVATQTGVTPNWDTVLARPEAQVPRATRVEIYRLGWDQQPPVLVHALAEPVMLGRSTDAHGFLVESAREDGSRWIGKASWTTGEIEWLVQGSEVNAFASLGPIGQLAWCRRAVDQEHFELAVRTADTQWSKPLAGGDWLMPTWAGRGDSLFVLSLQNKFLDAVFGNATSEVAFSQAMRRLPLATGAYDRVAYQATVVSHGEQTPGDSFLFWHPYRKCIAVWSPYASRGSQAVLARQDSYAGLLSDDGYMLVVAQGQRRPELYRHPVGKPTESHSMISGLAIPRSVRHSSWSHLLLAPNESGMVGLTGMQFLPAEDPEDLAAAGQ